MVSTILLSIAIQKLNYRIIVIQQVKISIIIFLCIELSDASNYLNTESKNLYNPNKFEIRCT